MSSTPPASHRFGEFFEADDSRIFRITLEGQDVFRLQTFSIVDPAIYGVPDQWNALVVEPVSGRHPDFHRLFLAGSGVDFVESDITEIIDEQSGCVIYRRGE